MSNPPAVSLRPDPNALGPVTDLYQLTMMAGYAAAGLEHARATFEVFVRRLPSRRAYLVFAGLEQAVADLTRLAFSTAQVEAIRKLPNFAGVAPSFFDTLADLRFRGDLWAVPEGSVVFAGEPIVRVVAPLPQAQWVETYLLASLGYPTLVASKAARVVRAAAGRPVFDFGTRRAHGPEAGLLAARAAILAGCSGTSNVEAALRLNAACVGTMAHSWIQAFDAEAAAFRAFAAAFGPATTLLVDTYDLDEGVAHAAEVEPPVAAIRIDSGDLDAGSRRARSILDARGRRATKILAGSDLDEHTIDRLVRAGAPIDAFGVGTEMVTSRDAPALSMVYKLVELDGVGRVKLSPGKRTYPLAKQVFRTRDADRRFNRDHVVRADEVADGEPLLRQVVRDGEILEPWPTLDAIRSRCADQIESLPARLRQLDVDSDYPVTYSDALEAEADRLGLRPDRPNRAAP